MHKKNHYALNTYSEIFKYRRQFNIMRTNGKAEEQQNKLVTQLCNSGVSRGDANLWSVVIVNVRAKELRYWYTHDSIPMQKYTSVKSAVNAHMDAFAKPEPEPEPDAIIEIGVAHVAEENAGMEIEKDARASDAAEETVTLHVASADATEETVTLHVASADATEETVTLHVASADATAETVTLHVASADATEDNANEADITDEMADANDDFCEFMKKPRKQKNPQRRRVRMALL